MCGIRIQMMLAALACTASAFEDKVDLTIRSFWDGTCKVYRYGESEGICEIGNKTFHSLGRIISVEPNGDGSASAVSSGGWLQVFDLSSPEVELLKLQLPGLVAVSRSPDGRVAVAARRKEGNTLFLIDSNWQVAKIALGEEFGELNFLSLSWSPSGEYLSVSTNQEESLNNGPRAAIVIKSDGRLIAKLAAANLVFLDNATLVGNPNIEAAVYRFKDGNLRETKATGILGVNMATHPASQEYTLFRCNRRFGEGDLFEPFNVARLYDIDKAKELGTIRFRGRPKFIIEQSEVSRQQQVRRAEYWNLLVPVLEQLFLEE